MVFINIFLLINSSTGEPMPLQAGTQAPNFTANTDSGGQLSLNNFKGKYVVLYFYPKDDTPGCTKEACSFRDNLESVTSLGAEVIGVSPDDADSHDKFKSKYNLNFHLVSDTSKSICQAYGVWGDKTIYGKTYTGVNRTTFIIDKDGVIRYVFPNVNVNGHAEAVIEKLKELQNHS
jgi:peroxiredoxin Q/BCP